MPAHCHHLFFPRARATRSLAGALGDPSSRVPIPQAAGTGPSDVRPSLGNAGYTLPDPESSSHAC
jgi:hypothetical protein